jgi:hypothetical protein
MTMQMTSPQQDLQLAAGLGAWFGSVYEGLGISGPYGANPSSKVDAGAYEISGTQVALRATPGGSETGRFNNAYGPNGDRVVPPVDQVDFDGQTGTAQGRTWASVTVKSGQLQGQKGYVAIEFLAPVGWTASHGGTGPAQGGGGGGGGGGAIEPASTKTETTTEKDWTPWILGGAAVVGLGIVGWAVFAKPKKGGARRMGRRRSGTRRHRR